MRVPIIDKARLCKLTISRNHKSVVASHNIYGLCINPVFSNNNNKYIMSNYYMPVCVLSLSFAIFHLVLTNALSGMLFYHLQWLRGEIEEKKKSFRLLLSTLERYICCVLIVIYWVFIRHPVNVCERVNRKSDSLDKKHRTKGEAWSWETVMWPVSAYQ